MNWRPIALPRTRDAPNTLPHDSSSPSSPSPEAPTASPLDRTPRFLVISKFARPQMSVTSLGRVARLEPARVGSPATRCPPSPPDGTHLQLSLRAEFARSADVLDRPTKKRKKTPPFVVRLRQLLSSPNSQLSKRLEQTAPEDAPFPSFAAERRSHAGATYISVNRRKVRPSIARRGEINASRRE